MEQCSFVADHVRSSSSVDARDGGQTEPMRGEDPWPRPIRSARRCTSCACRHLLLPVRADRSLGTGPAAGASRCGSTSSTPGAAGSRWTEPSPGSCSPATRPRAPRRGPPAAQGAGGTRPQGRRLDKTTPATATRSCGTGEVGHPRASCAARPLLAPGGPEPGGAPAPHGRHRGSARVAVARRRLDAQHAPAHRRRGAGAAAGGRGLDHAALGHPGHPGHPRVDRRRPDKPDRLAGALQDPRIGRAMSLVHRDPAQPWWWIAGAGGRHVAVGVRRPVHRTGGRAGDAVRTVGGCRWRSTCSRPTTSPSLRSPAAWATSPKRRSAGLQAHGRHQPRRVSPSTARHRASVGCVTARPCRAAPDNTCTPSGPGTPRRVRWKRPAQSPRARPALDRVHEHVDATRGSWLKRSR